MLIAAFRGRSRWCWRARSLLESNYGKSLAFDYPRICPSVTRAAHKIVHPSVFHPHLFYMFQREPVLMVRACCPRLIVVYPLNRFLQSLDANVEGSVVQRARRHGLSPKEATFL